LPEQRAKDAHGATRQTFDRNSRGKWILREKEAKNAGCAMRQNNEGT
jgi:hypothetical protein